MAAGGAVTGVEAESPESPASAAFDTGRTSPGIFLVERSQSIAWRGRRAVVARASSALAVSSSNDDPQPTTVAAPHDNATRALVHEWFMRARFARDAPL